MNLSNFSFNASCSCSDLSIVVKLDGTVLGEYQLTPEAVCVQHEFNDDLEQSRLLEIEMVGKTAEHTTVNEAGEILTDHTVSIEDFHLDGVELNYVFYSNCKYEHSYNNPEGESVTEQFFGNMGCNGTVRFEFVSPTYIWLLEKM